jgi:hypothetical protein
MLFRQNEVKNKVSLTLFKKEISYFFKYFSRNTMPFKIFESFLALKKWKTFRKSSFPKLLLTFNNR